MKQDEKLGRQFQEYSGTRQGHVKASGHFKTYINPCLTALDSTDLGFHIGPICVNSACCADDQYLLSDRKSGLQSSLDIVDNYSKRYRVIFNADKTKIVVTGSRLDMDFYADISPWHLNGEQVEVVADNDHLGLVVSRLQEEQKNVDRRISLSTAWSCLIT